ncbi:MULTISPECIES: hypothetical protein [unclassified Nocardioides]|uniref:hypothetical protein n=1 Tax=unclassified Nocardioides TaxID=2615069 RepID=UPI0030145D4F
MDFQTTRDINRLRDAATRSRRVKNTILVTVTVLSVLGLGVTAFIIAAVEHRTGAVSEVFAPEPAEATSAAAEGDTLPKVGESSIRIWSWAYNKDDNEVIANVIVRRPRKEQTSAQAVWALTPGEGKRQVVMGDTTYSARIVRSTVRWWGDKEPQAEFAYGITCHPRGEWVACQGPVLVKNVTEDQLGDLRLATGTAPSVRPTGVTASIGLNPERETTPCAVAYCP